MSDLPPAVVALGLLALLVVLGMFAVGTQGNVKRGNEALTWLQGGLPKLGRHTKLRWLGSTAVELTIDQAHAPYSQAQVLIVLEPRDVGLLWAWSRARGRRDFLVLRGRLARAPSFEVEVGRAGTYTGADRLARLDEGAWRWAEWAEPDVRAAYTPGADLAAARRAWEELARAGRMWRLSVRREHPHVEAHLALPGRDADPAGLIEAFLTLGTAVMRR